MKNSRRDRERRGRSAETIAAWLLRLKGYRILEQRIRLPAGEIDIVARRGRAVVLVELIARAAAQYPAGREDLSTMVQRFDTVLVVRGAWPQHIINAWSESGH